MRTFDTLRVVGWLYVAFFSGLAFLQVVWAFNAATSSDTDLMLFNLFFLALNIVNVTRVLKALLEY